MTKRIMITQLIGLCEAQRKIYDTLADQPERYEERIMRSYHHHEAMLEQLIHYQSETNGVKNR